MGKETTRVHGKGDNQGVWGGRYTGYMGRETTRVHGKADNQGPLRGRQPESGYMGRKTIKLFLKV